MSKKKQPVKRIIYFVRYQEWGYKKSVMSHIYGTYLDFSKGTMDLYLWPLGNDLAPSAYDDDGVKYWWMQPEIVIPPLARVQTFSCEHSWLAEAIISQRKWDNVYVYALPQREVSFHSLDYVQASNEWLNPSHGIKTYLRDSENHPKLFVNLK